MQGGLAGISRINPGGVYKWCGMPMFMGRNTYLDGCSNHDAMEDSLTTHCKHRLEGGIARKVKCELNIANLFFDCIGVIV